MPMEAATTQEHRAVPQLRLRVPTVEIDDHAAAAISVSGLVKDFGSTRALDRLDLTVRTGEVHGFLGPERRRQDDHDPRPARAAAQRRRARSPCWAATRGATRSALHRRLAYVPGEVNLWPNLTGGEVIDLLGTLRGGLDPSTARRAARAVPARPDQEDPRLLEGQPAEGGARRGVRLRRRAVPPGRADLGSGPVDGDRSSRTSSASCATRAGRCCCPATSSSEVEALCDRVTIIRAGRAAESGTFDELRHLTRTTVVVETARSRSAALGELAGRARRERRRHACAVQRRPRRAEPRAASAWSSYDVRSLTSSPPTLEELFLRHYGDDLATRDAERRCWWMRDERR